MVLNGADRSNGPSSARGVGEAPCFGIVHRGDQGVDVLLPRPGDVWLCRVQAGEEGHRNLEVAGSEGAGAAEGGTLQRQRGLHGRDADRHATGGLVGDGPVERRARARYREDVTAQEAERFVLRTHQVNVFASAGESVEGGVTVYGLVLNVTQPP